MSVLRYLMFVLWVAQGLSFAGEGGMDSGGVDNHDITFGSAWYLGDAPVKVCFERSPDFTVGQQVVTSEFLQAVKTWKEYTVQKKVHSISTVQGGFRPSFEYQVLPFCDSSEDLTVYLGVINEKIEKHKAHYSNPTAFVIRDSYDLKAARGKGWMWIAPPSSVYPGARYPDWNDSYMLRGVFLHEIGHILGLPEVEGTIMDGNSMTSKMQYHGLESRRKAWLTEIDDQTELYLCELCSFNKDGDLGGRYGNQSGAREKSFNQLMGRTSSGPIHASFNLFENSNQELIKELVVGDALGQKTFQIDYTDMPITFRLTSNLFSAVRAGTPPSIGNIEAVGISYYQDAGVRMGKIQYGDAQTLMVVVSRNEDSLEGPLVIYALENGKRVPLFSAFLPGLGPKE